MEHLSVPFSLKSTSCITISYGKQEGPMSSVINGPRCNRRVSCSPSTSNDRSESDLVANPRDPYNIVGASKRFNNPATYDFTLAAYATFDGGLSWTEGPLLIPSTWAGISDPAIAWDNMGNAYIVALPFPPGGGFDSLGIAVFTSPDGGLTWGPPNLIHSSTQDDKQGATGDYNPVSPFYGNVYIVWDDGPATGAQLRFARLRANDTTWRGVGTTPITGTSLANDSFSPEVTVSADGTIYVFWQTGEGGNQVKFVKSTDGGGSFSIPKVAVDGLTNLRATLEIIGTPPDLFPHFPGATFRVLTVPTCCTGPANTVLVAWADGREIQNGDHKSRIYYRRSLDGGTIWEGAPSGQPLLTGAAASSPDQHDFHPQIRSTPAGEIGCAFYEFGPRGGGEFPPSLIDVFLAVSTDSGATFPNRATVTDQPWDPAVDAPRSHGDPKVTFIGEYFGLAASRLGFFPFWTDTRTGTQEIFTSRLSVNPADVYIRDSRSDTGDVPSPGDHWEAPDLIVRRQPDGDAVFVNEDLLRDGVTDHYIYGNVTNKGPNTAHNVHLNVVVGNYPALDALPGAEFRYPQDWYQGDWDGPAQARHLVLELSPPAIIPSGTTKILGPITWPAAQIPSQATWHPCLLAEVRADNDDSAGGTNGCDIQINPGTCDYGSYFWGNNNVCQRNLTYAPVGGGTAALIEFPFLVGSFWSSANFLEVVLDKGKELAGTIMTLRVEPVHPRPGPPKSACCPVDLVLIDGGHVVVRVDDCGEVGEIIATPGTIWRTKCPPSVEPHPPETCFGGTKEGQVWRLTQPRAAVGLPVTAGEVLRATLSFTTPTTLQPGSTQLLRIFQRNDRRIVTGSVSLELVVS
jgi:hypothetical protein